MTTEADFLAAIHAEPDDRATLGVFADWLEERDDPRAVLVRSHAAGEGIDLESAAAQPLRLLRAVGAVEADPRGLIRLCLRRTPDVVVPDSALGWGWITEIEVARSELLCGLPDLFARFPLLPRLTLRPRPSELAQWQQQRLLLPTGATLRLCIDHAHEALAPHLDTIAFWPSPRALRELALRHCGLGDAGVIRLMRGSGLGQLRRLELDGNSISKDGAAALADCPTLTRLEVLSLLNNPLHLAGLTALMQSDHLPALRELHLARTAVGLAGIGTWLRSRFAPPVTADVCVQFDREAEYERTSTPEGVRVQLAGWDPLAEVAAVPIPEGTAELRMYSSCDWKAGDTADLFTVPAVPRLRTLLLGVLNLTPDGVRELLDRSERAGLHALILHGQFGPDVCRTVLARPHRLIELHLVDPSGSEFRLTADGAALRLYLRQPPSWLLDALERSPERAHVTELTVAEPASGLALRLARLLPGLTVFRVRHAGALTEAERQEAEAACGLSLRPEDAP